jgi:hypothetical protein
LGRRVQSLGGLVTPAAAYQNLRRTLQCGRERCIFRGGPPEAEVSIARKNVISPDEVLSALKRSEQAVASRIGINHHTLRRWLQKKGAAAGPDRSLSQARGIPVSTREGALERRATMAIRALAWWPKTGSDVKLDTGPLKENYRALPYGVTVSLITKRTRLGGLLNRPQRKPLSRT